MSQNIAGAMGIVPNLHLEPEIDDAPHGELIECDDGCSQRDEIVEGQNDGTACQYHGPVGVSAI